MPRHCQGAFGLAAAGRKGGGGYALAFLGRQRCNTIGNGKGGRWWWWACCGNLGGATSARQQGRRVAVGVLWLCPDGIFEVALAGQWQRGREGRGGTTRFAR
jgi:hypothetical protein